MPHPVYLKEPRACVAFNLSPLGCSRDALLACTCSLGLHVLPIVTVLFVLLFSVCCLLLVIGLCDCFGQVCLMPCYATKSYSLTSADASQATHFLAFQEFHFLKAQSRFFPLFFTSLVFLFYQQTAICDT